MVATAGPGVQSRFRRRVGVIGSNGPGRTRKRGTTKDCDEENAETKLVPFRGARLYCGLASSSDST